MSKTEAMKKYVCEITKVMKIYSFFALIETKFSKLFLQIVETMSFTPNVEEFLETLGPFYEYVADEKQCSDVNSNGMDQKGRNLDE
jgi:hypothetical protein